MMGSSNKKVYCCSSISSSRWKSRLWCNTWMCNLRHGPWNISCLVTIAQACVMFPFTVPALKFGATLRDFMFGQTVKAQVILFHNI